MATFERGQFVIFKSNNPKAQVRWRAFMYVAESDTAIFTASGEALDKDSFEFYPLDGNEYLLGTRLNIFPKWKPEAGELVAVSNDTKHWSPRIFVEKTEAGYLCDSWSKDYSCEGLSSSAEEFSFCEPLLRHFNISKE